MAMVYVLSAGSGADGGMVSAAATVYSVVACGAFAPLSGLHAAAMQHAAVMSMVCFVVTVCGKTNSQELPLWLRWPCCGVLGCGMSLCLGCLLQYAARPYVAP